MNLNKQLVYIREIYRPFYRRIAVLIALILGIQSLMLVTPLFSGQVIDGLIKKKPEQHLWMLAVVLLGFLAMKHILELFHGIQHIGKVTLDSHEKVVQTTLGRVMKLSLGQISTHNSGFRKEIISKGEVAIEQMMDLIVMKVLPYTFRITVALIAMFYLNVYLGLVLLVSVVGYIGTSIYINQLRMPDLVKQNQVNNKLMTHYTEIMRHLRLVMTHTQEKRMTRDYLTEYHKYNTDGKRIWIRYFWQVTLLREPFSALGQFGILLLCIHFNSTGVSTAGDLVKAMGWSLMAFSAMGDIGSTHRNFVRLSIVMGRYFKLLDMPPSITIVSNPVRPARFEGHIEFRNVSFEYPTYDRNEETHEVEVLDGEEIDQAIKNVSFTIKPGTTCALVGPSGAGKTTLINLILRGYDPTEGQILIDGHDLRLLDFAQWRRNIGYVEQNPVLWDNTLRYNMTYGLNGRAHLITDAELHALARRTRIDEFYPRLGSRGFDAYIGENGVQLSGGQRQRVAIARAIITSPSLVILDEATNALDPLNERLIHEAINEALVGRTGIIIAHRLSTVRHADQIIVFEGGQVVGNGSHQKLMESCNTYFSLVEHELKVLQS